MAKFVSKDNMTKILTSLKGEFVKKVDAKEGLQLSQESFTTDEKTKLGKLVTDDQGVLAANNIPNIAAAKVTGVLAAENIPNIAAAKVTGVLSIDNIPHGALERCVPVEDQKARFALTKDQVQTGDTVKQNDTGVMYFVKDDDNLSSEDGYEIYKAGSAASVPWGGVEGRPETMKNPTSLTIQVEGNEVAVYDGAEAKTVNITAADINVAEITEDEITEMLKGTYTEA